MLFEVMQLEKKSRSGVTVAPFHALWAVLAAAAAACCEVLIVQKLLLFGA